MVVFIDNSNNLFSLSRILRSDKMLKEILQPTKELQRSYIDVDTSHLPINELPEEITLTISFVESISGGEKEVIVPIKVKCKKCHQNGNYAEKLLNVCKFCNGVGFKTFKSSSGSDQFQIACKFCGGNKFMNNVVISDLY